MKKGKKLGKKRPAYERDTNYSVRASFALASE